MEFISAIQATPYSELVRNSSVVYPLLQIIHIVGIAIAVGSLIAGNARLLGAANALPVSVISRPVYRWAAFGIGLVLFSGIQMAIGFIHVFSINPVMWIKMSMLAAALGLNLRLAQRWVAAPAGAAVGRGDRFMAFASITLLLGVIVMGKLLAYIGGKD
jgi:hypothetical protein